MLWMSMALAGGNVTVSEMTVNGVEALDVSCELEGFDFTWLLKFQEAISSSKEPGDACVSRGTAARVRWEWGKGKKGTAVVVNTNATPKESKCLSKVLSAPHEAFSATCEATVLYGEKLHARTAAEALKKPVTDSP